MGPSFILDRYGRYYWSVSGGAAPGKVLPLSAGEGYIERHPEQIVSQISGSGNIPSEQDVYETITGLCGNAGVVVGIPNPNVTWCKNEATAFVYGYSGGIGASLVASWGFEPAGENKDLAWDYIDRIPGISAAEVMRELGSYLPCYDGPRLPTILHE